MAQNTSTAVMQRRVEPHDSLDDFPTPPWATRALIEHVIVPTCPGDAQFALGEETAWEPACNRGHMSRPLREYFGTVRTSDIHDYGSAEQEIVTDFLFPQSETGFSFPNGLDWIITNPPFRLAMEFLFRGFSLCPRGGIAIIVRSAFLEGVTRHNVLFKDYPPNIIAQFSERVVMHKGKLSPRGSTATAYCWLVWLTLGEGTTFQWIPPCRKELERPEDYAEAT